MRWVSMADMIPRNWSVCSPDGRREIRLVMPGARPVSARKRTSKRVRGRSQKCQKPTFALELCLANLSR